MNCKVKTLKVAVQSTGRAGEFGDPTGGGEDDGSHRCITEDGVLVGFSMEAIAAFGEGDLAVGGVVDAEPGRQAVTGSRLGGREPSM